MAQEIKSIPLEKLRLWTENPRDPVDGSMSDYDVIHRALTDSDKKWNLQKLLDDMGQHYDYSELPTIVANGDDYVVYDGNRRIAILKYLKNSVLQDSLEKQLVVKENQKLLTKINELPCNICDRETALINIERKHWNSGGWGRLERDYFSANFRGKPKSDYVKFDEQTNLISTYPVLNQRFVKDEVLTSKVLNKIGLNFNPESGIMSMYDRNTTIKIINEVISLLETKKVSTRKNRGDLLTPLLEQRMDLKKTIREYDKETSKEIQYYVQKKKPSSKTKEKKKNINSKSKRRTGIKKESNILFGNTLYLKKGNTNNLYRGIEKIYNQNEKDLETVLPIIAISLRLLLETAAREYYKETNSGNPNSDQVYKMFIKKAKKAMKPEKSIQNFFSLTNTWLNSKYNLEAVLGKFAHGNIIVVKNDMITTSIIIGDIINFYFKRD